MIGTEGVFRVVFRYGIKRRGSGRKPSALRLPRLSPRSAWRFPFERCAGYVCSINQWAGPTPYDLPEYEVCEVVKELGDAAYDDL